MSATTVDPAVPVAGRARGGDRIRTGLRGTGQLLITLGVVLLLFVVYELWWTGFGTARAQAGLFSTFQHTSAELATKQPPISSVPVGKGIAVLYIPRFGASYHEVIVQGTDFDSLAEGPGHWLDSAYPGQVGNFYVAGHRTTHTAPFNKLAELHDGDLIYVETTRSWFTYQLEAIPGTHANWQEIVSPDDLSISYPVPDQADKSLKPHLAVLTLSTCNPEYSATSRLVVHGLLVAHHSRTHGYVPPAEVHAVADS